MSTSYIETTYKVKKGEYTGTLLSSLSVMVFTDWDLGTRVDEEKAKEGCRGPKSQVKQGYFIFRNACLYIFNKNDYSAIKNEIPSVARKWIVLYVKGH